MKTRDNKKFMAGYLDHPYIPRTTYSMPVVWGMEWESADSTYSCPESDPQVSIHPSYPINLQATPAAGELSSLPSLLRRSSMLLRVL